MKKVRIRGVITEELTKASHIIYNVETDYISKDKIREKLQELRDKEQELSDEQGYWGSADILAKIEILIELLEE